MTSYTTLIKQIRQWSKDLGFQQFGISSINLDRDKRYLEKWLASQYHGEMFFMEKHGDKRSHPEQLVPGTIRVLSFRMDYFPATARPAKALLQEKDKAYISRYALGRDYHKKIRKALAQIGEKIAQQAQEYNPQFRVFSDSAPVLERALARNAGLGWSGKNTCLINPKAGSWFFLGEIYTNIPLPCNEPFTQYHCGSCTACMDICPTNAIISANTLDARRCISYLTIEYNGTIPLEFRTAIGNRIYGCDDCQIVCPWNRFSHFSQQDDFQPRHNLDDSKLTALFSWTEKDFLKKLEGSPIRRIGYEKWLRNIAVALGNSSNKKEAIQALKNKLQQEKLSDLVKEHIDWALYNLVC